MELANGAARAALAERLAQAHLTGHGSDSPVAEPPWPGSLDES
jgi:hypothetical protein